MYYYIFEQPKSIGATKKHDNIRKIISELGIIGEIVTVSPARTTQELTEMGVEKKYNTIVAVGSDSHINKVGTYLKNKNVVLGIIPVGCSEIIHKLIGAEEIKDACEILKYRKLKEVSLAAVEPNKYFITQIEIQTSASVPVTITVINPGMDSYHVESTFSEMIVSRNLYLFMTDKFMNYSFIKNAWSWLVGQKTPDNISSILRGKKMKIETNEPIPVTMDNEIIAKTPIVLTLYPRALKIITKPARMVSEKEKNHKK